MLTLIERNELVGLVDNSAKAVREYLLWARERQ